MKQKDTLSFNQLKDDKFSDEAFGVDEFTFWKYYINILQLQTFSLEARLKLSDTEIDVLSYILTGTPGRSYFKAPASKEIKDKFGLTTNNFHRIKYVLEEKGFIQRTEIPGDYVLVPTIDRYQRGIKKILGEGRNIEFKFKFKLDEEN